MTTIWMKPSTKRRAGSEEEVVRESPRRTPNGPSFLTNGNFCTAGFLLHGSMLSGRLPPVAPLASRWRHSSTLPWANSGTRHSGTGTHPDADAVDSDLIHLPSEEADGVVQKSKKSPGTLLFLLQKWSLFSKRTFQKARN